MATTVGHAQIEISPELNNAALRRFEAVFRGHLTRIERTSNVAVQVEVNDGPLTRLQRRLQRMDTVIRAEVEVDDSAVGRLQRRLRSLRPLKIPVDVDRDRFHQRISLARDVVQRRLRPVEVEVRTDHNLMRRLGQRMMADITEGLLTPIPGVLVALRTGIPTVLGSPIGLAMGVLGVSAAAAFVAAFLGAAALGAIGAGLIALGAVALRENERIGAAFENTVDRVSKGFADAASGLVEPFTDALNTVGDFFESDVAPRLKNVFNDLAPAIEPLVRDILQGIEDFIAEIEPHIEDFVKDFLIPMGPIVEELLEQFGEFFGELMKHSTEFYLAMKLTLGVIVILLTVLEEFMVNSARVLAGFQLAADGIVAAWNAVWPSLKKAWDAFVDWLEETWESFRDEFAIPLWESVSGAVTTAWDATWEALESSWNSFSQWLEITWEVLIGAVRNIWNNISSTITGIWNGIWNALRSAWNSFSSFISSAWNSFVATARRIWSNVSSTVSGIWEALWDSLERLWNAFLSFITGAWNRFISTANNLWTTISRTITGIWTDLWDEVEEVWEGLRARLERSIDTFRANVVNFFDRAAKGIRDTWNDIKEFAAEPVRFVINTVWNNGIGGLWNKAREVFKSMPEFPRASVNFATGGIYPGYTPGRDIGVAAVSGGEAIMRPEWTRAIGAKNIHEMNRIARTKGVEGVRRHYLGEYATGGIIPDWIPGSGVVDDIFGKVRDLAGTTVSLLFFNNPVAEAVAKAVERGIDSSTKDEGWEQIPRRFAVGIYDHVLARLASLATPAFGTGGDQGVGSSALLQAMIAFVRKFAPGARVSSGSRPGDWGYHGRNRAIDIIFSDGSQNRSSAQAPAGQAARAAQAITQYFMSHTLELIWDPLKSRAIWNGRPHFFTGPTAGPGTHNDHIHWAFGGTVDQLRAAITGGAPTGADATSGSDGSAKFGSLANATGLWDQYKKQVMSSALFGGLDGSPLVNADGSVMQQAFNQARAMGASNKVLLALFMAGFVESGFRNLPYGDRDSVGFLQQRPSQGWGSVSQIMNVPFATRSFVSRAMAIERRNPGIGAGALAQAVQRSAFPHRYEQMRGQATAALRRLAPNITFDRGGFLPTGTSVVTNHTGRPEPVLTSRQWAALVALSENQNPVEIVIENNHYLDGKALDVRTDARIREHDKRLVRAVTARRRR